MKATMKTFRVSKFDLIAAMVFLGKKVKADEIADHMYNANWSDVDKYDISAAVKKALTEDLEMRPEDHYGIRESNGFYWLAYRVDSLN